MNEASPCDRSRYQAGTGTSGILLLHGYTASPGELRPMGEFLSARGMRVVIPLLPGHGTSAADLNGYHWREVAEAAAQELYGLMGECEQVFVGGVSMGGLLALHLAQRCPDIAGVIPMATALYLRDPLHYLLPWLSALPLRLPKSRDIRSCVEDSSCGPGVWSYDETPVRFAAQLVSLMHHVRAHLFEVRVPILAFHGRQDRAVPVRASRAIVDRAGSTDTQLLVLPNSGHCITVDGEREQLFASAWAWLEHRMA